jgi:hypothetical protein
LRDHRGYLNRLVDDVPGRRGRAARSPRQISWGPTRPASFVDDVDAPVAPVAAKSPTAQPIFITRDLAPQTQRRPRRQPATHPPQPPARGVPEPSRAVAPKAHVARPQTDVPRPTSRPATATEPVVVPARPAALGPEAVRARGSGATTLAAPPEPQPVPARTKLPPAVTAALDRLAALSLPVPPSATKPDAQPKVSMPAPVQPVTRTPERPAAVAVLPRTPSEQPPPRTPHVHIGSIEVTIAPSAPPPVRHPVPAPLPPSAPAPLPVQRLSRPSAAYGFGQG